MVCSLKNPFRQMLSLSLLCFAFQTHLTITFWFGKIQLNDPFTILIICFFCKVEKWKFKKQKPAAASRDTCLDLSFWFQCFGKTLRVLVWHTIRSRSFKRKDPKKERTDHSSDQNLIIRAPTCREQTWVQDFWAVRNRSTAKFGPNACKSKSFFAF